MKIKQQVTEREKEILVLMAKGKTTPEIAAALGISEKTVETHRKNLLGKFNALNAVMLMHVVTKNNII